MKKLKTYQDVKNFCSPKNFNPELINIDDYTDEENIQITKWIIQAKQECLKDEDLLNLTEEEISLYGFNNENILIKVINENYEKYLINGNKIIGKCIIDYPEFKIIKEENKNNFYRIMKNER